ncbi:MAG: hypothetical protein B6242_03745 [Anaerolineaceae bacterium 4572_78]|nr:MAG: hypothetical protein B6242_03745 [Anaerolineaceae bacterium 4572_78]
MFRPRWRKVIRDLWLNRARTILVVLSVAVGVFSVGVIGTSRFVLSEQLNASYMATNPTAALLMTSTAFDKKMVESIRNMPEVAEAEGRRNVGVRLKLGENEWRSMQLNIIDDFDDIRVDKIYHEEGQWPPGKQEILVERGALGLTNAEIGDEVIIRAPNGKERVVRIVGTAHDLYAQMYTLSGFAYGYATFDVLEWLGEPRDFNDLRFTVAENSMDREHITIVAQDVQDKLEKGGVGIFFNMAMVPGQHPLNFIIEPMLAMLGVLGLLALILSAFLVINMISALLTQQRKQIGVMKAIGATASQLLVMYFVNVILLGVLSLVISVPLGMLGAQMFSEGMAGMLNFDIDNFYIPPPVLIAQIVVALFVPVVASTYPILMGVRVTVREAISDYGIGKAFGQSIIDRILIKLRFQFLTRPTIISLRFLAIIIMMLLFNLLAHIEHLILKKKC